MGDAVEQVAAGLDARFDEFFHRTSTGELKPYVCCCCDEIMGPSEVTTVSLETLRKHSDVLRFSKDFHGDISSALRESYIYKGQIKEGVATAEDKKLIKSLILSPRASYLRTSMRNRSRKGYQKGISICVRCKENLLHNYMPEFAIANNYMLGQCPLELSELSDYELAFLSPVKAYGHCFTYTGGSQKKLRGSCSFFKVDMDRIGQNVCMFEALGLNKNLVVIFYGKLTASQKERARRKVEVDPAKLYRALLWLCENNCEWLNRKIDVNEIMGRLEPPVLIDHSHMEEGSRANVEEQESFQVYFPDGSASSSSGGQDSIQKFRELIAATRKAGFSVQCRTQLAKEGCADFKDSNLVNACILQFPFGRGGINEPRMNADLS